jgi:hypothetical protein
MAPTQSPPWQPPYYDDGLLDEYENGGADIVALGDSWFHYPGPTCWRR